MFRWLPLLLLLALHAVPAAAESPISLYCARGVAEYPDAEMHLNLQGRHIVDVIFVGYRPSRARAEWSLRDCLRTASKLDNSRQIVARLWYRERRARHQEPLAPYSLASGSASFGSSFSAVATR